MIKNYLFSQLESRICYIKNNELFVVIIMKSKAVLDIMNYCYDAMSFVFYIYR